MTLPLLSEVLIFRFKMHAKPSVYFVQKQIEVIKNKFKVNAYQVDGFNLNTLTDLFIQFPNAL